MKLDLPAIYFIGLFATLTIVFTAFAISAAIKEPCYIAQKIDNKVYSVNQCTGDIKEVK
jgi:hypothetical protein